MEEINSFLAQYELSDIFWGIVKAILVIVIGLPVIRVLTGALSRFMNKRNIDASLKPFLLSLFKNILRVLLIVTALSMLGVEMTSFVAIIGAAGLAVGLALQGTLQNFAGGVIILLLRPFKTGDYIEGGGEAGTVKEIRIFNTILNTPDNVRVMVPNGKLSNDNIKNYSAENTRRVDMVFGIGYSDDIKKAKDLLEKIVTSDERVLKDPAPQIVVGELGDSSVNFNVRPWVKGPDYWDVYFDMHQKVKEEFDANGISIPFPQRDVHLIQEGAD
jgi:small conductance mechanosensitive channel